MLMRKVSQVTARIRSEEKILVEQKHICFDVEKAKELFAVTD